MNKQIRTTLGASLCLTLLVACGGGSSKGDGPDPIPDDDDTQTENSAPVLEEIADQSVLFGESVTLRASATDDGLPDGSLTANWRFLSGPDNAGDPTFSTTDEMEVSISFSSAGAYQFSVSVSDGEYTVDSRFQIDVEGYEVTSFNNGLQVTLPANYLPSNSYDAAWINRVWEGVTDCMSSETADFSATAIQRAQQLTDIIVYKADDYDETAHGNSGDPDTWTSISVEADGLVPSANGFQGSVLAEKMVDYLLLYNNRPVDGSIVCGSNHASRRHAEDIIVPSVEASPVTQDIVIDGVNIVVEAEELPSETMIQLIEIAQYLTNNDENSDSTPLTEIRIVDDIQSLANLEIWDASGGFSVESSMVALLRENIADDLYEAANYQYPGDWIERYRQAYEDYFWDEELEAVTNMTCCLPFD